MRFGLLIRGQYPAGDDMRVRLKEDLDAAKRAAELGYDVLGKARTTVRTRFNISSRFRFFARSR